MSRPESDALTGLTAEERHIYSRVSRRGFMGATAGATLAALAGREPAFAKGSAQQASTAPARRSLGEGGTADAVIVLWMAGGMAQTETFDPKRYTPFQPGVNIKDVLSTFPTIDTAVDNIKFTQGLGAGRQRHRPRDGHPHLQRRRPRLHPALAPPISLAYGVHPAPADGDAASRRGRLENARPEEPGCARLHRHRTDGRRRGGDWDAQGISHRRLPGLGARTIPDHRSAGRGLGRPAAQGARRRAVSHAPAAPRKAPGAGAGASIRQRLPADVARALARGRRSPADVALGEGLRPLARAAENVRRLQHRTVRSGLPPGPATGRGRRPIRRSDLGVHPVCLLGHPRARARPRGRDEEGDRRARSRS